MQVTVLVSEDFPTLVYLDLFLFKLILSNAFTNAVVHGKTNGSVKFLLQLADGECAFCFCFKFL